MDLAFDAVGAGQGTPVLCLPMFTTTRQVTAAALGPAFGADRRQLYVDLPGHGESEPTAEPTAEAMLAAVASFVTRHDEGGGVLLAGCSYGGYIAAAIARRWPERVRGLFLVCPGVRADPSMRDLPAPHADGEAGWLDGVAPEFESHLDRALGNRVRSVAARVSDLLAGGTSGDARYQERVRAEGYALSDEDARIPFDGPTTVLAGRQDRVAGFADQYRQMPLYPNGTFLVLDGAGHYLPFEHPDVLPALAGDWLRRCG